MNRHLLPALYTVLMVAGVLFVVPNSAYAEQANHDRIAMDDSLRSVEQIRAEIDRVEAEITDTKSQLENADEGDREQLETELASLEQELEELQSELSAAEALSDEGWGFEEYEESDEEFDWEYDSDGMDEVMEFGSEFFKKYPPIFDMPFPLETGFAKSFVRYNRAEGFYLGAAKTKRLNWHSEKVIVSTGFLGYGFANHHWRYGLGLYAPIYFENDIIEIGAEGHSTTDSKDQWMIGLEENSLMAFFANEDFMDYFERQGYSASANWYHRFDDEAASRFGIAYMHDTYDAMIKKTDWALFGWDKEFRENPIENNDLYRELLADDEDARPNRFMIGNLNSIFVSASLKTTPDDSRAHGWDANLTFETAGDFLAGDYEFDQLIVDVRRYQPLGEYFNFNTRLRLGGSSGYLPYQRTFDVGGIGTLPAYRFKEFTGANMGLYSAELIVKSSIAGVSDGWFSRLMDNFNVILFYDVGAVASSEPPVLTPEEIGNEIIPLAPYSAGIADGIGDLADVEWKNSLGVAVGNENGTYRIGVAWRMDGSNTPEFVFRLSSPF
ncbi:MAG: hypothetical protein CL946_09255 [Ectothiorhodospiraceae bacterium]|nr:hypothetical protein [Ectothiorhodospiraceae bacterium]